MSVQVALTPGLALPSLYLLSLGGAGRRRETRLAHLGCSSPGVGRGGWGLGARTVAHRMSRLKGGPWCAGRTWVCLEKKSSSSMTMR